MSDAFENKIREKLSEADLPFDAGAWQKMERKLDALNDDHTRPGWWLAVLLLLMSIGAFMWWSNTANKIPVQQAVMQQQPENKNQAAPPSSDTAISHTPGDNTAPVQQPAPDAPAAVNTSTAGSSKTNSNNNAITANKNQVTPAPPVTTQDPQQPAAAQQPAEKPAAVAAITDSTQKTHAVARQPNVKEPTKPVNSDSNQVSKQQPPSREKKQEDGKPAPRKGFAVGITLGPDFNVAPSLQFGRIGLHGGVLVHYHLNNRWSFTTGVIYAHKPYGATRNDYAVFNKYPPAYSRYVKWVDANCWVLDVPLNINFTFMDRPKYALSASAGMSSYFMVTEKYNYKMQYGADQPKEFYNDNQHPFSVLNVAFIYQKPVSKRLSIAVQPFVKIPVGRIGFGEVKLYSTGVSFQANFHR